MNYAYQDDKTYTTTKNILKNTPLSKEAKQRRDFIRSHKFVVAVDKNTLKCELKITSKEQ